MPEHGSLSHEPLRPARHHSARPAVRCALAATCTAFLLLFALGCSAPSAGPAAYPATEFSGASDESSPESASTGQPPSSPVGESSAAERAAEAIASLTLEQKVAQLFVVRPEAITGVGTATRAGATTERSLHDYPVGGIVYFKKNLIDADQAKTMIANSQAYSEDAVGLPLFACVDEEGGTVSRIGGNAGFGIADVGSMADIGASGDTARAKTVASTIGGYLGDLGFNVDFAPDADIRGDSATDVMALRSFGTDAALVASMVSAQVEGFAETGVLCSAKHFPGIGGLVGDSHEGAVVSNKSLDELRATELAPFQAAIEAGVPIIMVGHLSAPNAFGSSVPAALNAAAVTDLLRGELGFEGLIITDSMEMGAVDDYAAPDEAGVMALQAGADLVLMPADFHAAYQGVLDAVANGTLSEERIDESVSRIVRTKLELAA